MSKQVKEMVGEYEVTQSLRMGGKVLLIGLNEKNTEAPYMTCRKVSGPFGEVYGDMVIGSDYLAIMRLFSDRLQEQVKSVERTRAEHNVPLETLGIEHCRVRGEEENLAGNLIIIRPSSLAPGIPHGGLPARLCHWRFRLFTGGRRTRGVFPRTVLRRGMPLEHRRRAVHRGHGKTARLGKAKGRGA